MNIECKLIVVDEPTFDVNMKAVAYHRSSIVHKDGGNKPSIPNLYYNEEENDYQLVFGADDGTWEYDEEEEDKYMIYSTRHDGKWYHLYVLASAWKESDPMLFDLIQSGLEPYQAFEVLAL